MIDQIWAAVAIETCLRHGIDHFFLAPGSRCTPMTLAVARQGQAQTVQHFDERGLAFAALGYGRATGRPAVFICTSGTAVANALPAVIEAAMESVPMLLFTADRPTELRGSGANQTIDQVNIFGDYPELFIDMPVPGDVGSPEDADGLNWLRDELASAIARTQNGPVHLNWMFREPFTIESTTGNTSAETDGLNLNQYKHEAQASESQEVDLTKINLRGNVLIALGGCKPEEAEQAIKLSKRLSCPLLSDVTSGVQAASFELPTEFDLPTPDTILHLGGRIVSKSWHQWTSSLDPGSVSFFHLTPTGQTINPNGLAVRQIHTSLLDLESKVVGSACAESFLQTWSDAARKRDEIVAEQLSNAPKISEPAIAFHVNRYCPRSSGLFIGNSTPIRDMDWFGVGMADGPRLVAANRGASGIDGLLATATGYATGLQQPVTVVVGDLSALHDLNSLALLAKSKWPLTVVILNNQAGHIFDLLPIRESPHFEQYFATPHSYQFEHVAKMFGLDYRYITKMDEFVSGYQDALAMDRSIVLEVMTDREHNLEVRKQFHDEVRTCRARD